MLALCLLTAASGCAGVLRPKVIEVPVLTPGPPPPPPRVFPPECFQKANPAPAVSGQIPSNEREALAIVEAENEALRSHAQLEARGRNVCVDAHLKEAE
jgi:hypothetical protein